jgi:hypothetical protein
MNRAIRRKHAMAVANDIIKGRVETKKEMAQNAKVKPMRGFGFVFTNTLGVITVWHKTYLLWDKRIR